MPENEFPKLRPHPFRQRSQAGADGAPAAGTAPGVPGYAELCVTSNYTFLTGASHPEEFVIQAALLGYRAVAVTDTHSVAGVVRAHVAAKDAGVRFVLGTRVRPQDAPGASVLLYPTSMDAYRRLCRLLTVGKRRAPKGECHLRLDDLADHHGGLLAIAMADGAVDASLERLVDRLRTVYDDDRLSLAARVGYGPDDDARLGRLDALATRTGVPLVATSDAAYHHPDRRMLHDVVTCIRHGCTLAQAGFRLEANAERHLKPADEMHRLFADRPGAVARTLEIVARTSGFSLDHLRYEYPDEIVPAGRTAQEHLRDLTWSGARAFYGRDVPEKVARLVEHELGLIGELNYAPYFLTVHDLVRFARTGEERPGDGPVEGWAGEILCQGRGAAANSAVCFCLGVTAVNPTEIDLLFERFVSKERNEPPDIDIDFEHERREEVIQYIYRKYGRERAALTAEVITYRRRSAVRDVGKALGLSLDLVDRLAKDIEWFDAGDVDAGRLRELGVNADDPTMRWFTRLVSEILGFPRHLSQHVGGFVITRSPLCELVPVENAAMPDRTVIEWDKDDVDAAGMLKVDVLGLGMLSALRRCLGYVNERRCRGVEVSGRRGETDEPVEVAHGQDRVVSGSDRVAEKHGPDGPGVQSDGSDAAIGGLRSHRADASSGGVDPVEHRRGIQPQDTPGIPARAPGGEWLTGRTVDPVADRSRAGISAQRRGDRDAAGRGRPDAVRADPVALEPLTPRHLDTSTPQSLCLRTIPRDDRVVYAMIQRADTVGVFQIESRAQMSMLPRLKPTCFYDLVIEVAIVRPGPIQGGMVHPYLRRRDGLEAVETLPDTVPAHVREGVSQVLSKTLGVPLFQEQCMALAVKAAGFSPGKADQLRRAMAAWKRKGDQICRFGQELIGGMTANGIPRDFAERCFRQVQGFSEYGFPESHAASFALLVYASSWLKCYYPAEFCAALLNSQPMGFYPPAQLVRDAKEHGVEVRPIDVNVSGWECSMEHGVEVPRCQGVKAELSHPPLAPRHLDTSAPSVRLGFRLVNGVGRAEAERIRGAVVRLGPFRSMLALWRASGVKVKTMRRLAAADAFGSMGLSRQQALWQARLLRDDPLPLFDAQARDDGADAAGTDADGLDRLPAVSAQRQVTLDYDATGLSLKAHPVSFARVRLREMRVVPCADLADSAKTPEGELVRVAGLVLVRQRPGTANDVTFMTLEDETGIANLIVWLRVYEKYRRAAAARFVVATGRVQRVGLVVHVTVTRLERFEDGVEPLRVAARNFH